MVEREKLGYFFLARPSSGTTGLLRLHPHATAAPRGLQPSPGSKICALASCCYWTPGASTTLLGSLYPNHTSASLPFVNISPVEPSEWKSGSASALTDTPPGFSFGKW